MSILFVLLTFLLILTVMYFRRPQGDANVAQVTPPKKASAPLMLKQANFEVPQDYCFHPGHTWVLDEGRQNARVGIDAFAGHLLGRIDSLELAELNRWVRQGQTVCTITRAGRRVDLLSPVEGVLVSINHEAMTNPNLVTEDPYGSGWVCMIKVPEMAINMKNLLNGSMVLPWMQNCQARLSAMVQQLTPALAQDGGLPVKGLLFQVDAKVQAQIAREFLLT